MKTITVKILLTSFLLISMQAQAGRESGGGDSIANTKGGRSLLDIVESGDIEYFSMRMSTYHPALKNTYNRFYQWDGGVSSPRFAFWGHLEGCLDENTVLESSLISKAWGSKPLRWAFTNQDLEEINDEGVIRVENSQTKKQLAIQKNGLVLVSKSEFRQLDELSKAALKIHEAAICAVQKLNPKLIQEQGTSKIRAFVRAIVNYVVSHQSDTQEPLPAYAITAAIDELGLPNPSPNNPYSNGKELICSIKSDVYDLFNPSGCVHAVVSEDGQILSPCYSDLDLRNGLISIKAKRLIAEKICSSESRIR